MTIPDTRPDPRTLAWAAHDNLTAHPELFDQWAFGPYTDSTGHAYKGYCMAGHTVRAAGFTPTGTTSIKQASFVLRAALPDWVVTSELGDREGVCTCGECVEARSAYVHVGPLAQWLLGLPDAKLFSPHLTRQGLAMQITETIGARPELVDA